MNELVAGGHRLEAVRLGPAPGATPTLVFLHEGLGCVSAWRDFPERVVSATGLGDIGGVFSLVWQRFPEGWRIVHDHTSAVESSQ